VGNSTGWLLLLAGTNKEWCSLGVFDGGAALEMSLCMLVF
jgi:hypothetical protein